MPAACEQAGERRLQVERLQVERGDVTVEVVHRHERQPPGPGDCLRGREADEQRADQPGTCGDRDGIHVVERCTGEPERFPDHRRDELEMPSRGDLRHHSAESRMELGLRADDAGANLAVMGDDGSSRLVAGRLDSEDHGPSGLRHMIRASSRLSV